MAIKPRGYKIPVSYFKEYPVYKTKIFDLMPEIRENIAIYKAAFFIPFCFMKKNDYTVVLRPSNYKNKNEFAMIWVSDSIVREKLERYFRKNIPFTGLSITSSEVINIEAEQGEGQEGFEKKIIDSINYYKG